MFRRLIWMPSGVRSGTRKGTRKGTRRGTAPGLLSSFPRSGPLPCVRG